MSYRCLRENATQTDGKARPEFVFILAHSSARKNQHDKYLLFLNYSFRIYSDSAIMAEQFLPVQRAEILWALSEQMLLLTK